MKLPKKHLSFSQIDLWLKAPETYRKKYYPEQMPPFQQSPEMKFGNDVTLAMERGEDWTEFIPRYKRFEHKLMVEIGGVPIMAFVDNIEPSTMQFAEQKTGRTPWTQNKVNKHIQLDIYSLLLQKKWGRVCDECFLVWVKTEKVNKQIEMNGHILEGESQEIKLTGEFEMFSRVITQEDRDKMEATIIKVAREIEEDFAAMKHLYQ